MRPTLIAYVDGARCAALEPPADFGARAWLLAVMAVQATVERGRPRAILRVNVTGGGGPQVIELEARSRVDIALTPDGADVALPALEAPPVGDDAAVIRLGVDGVVLGDSALPGSLATARAFSHVYSRWLRNGGHESGFDLTRFQKPEPGNKYDRLVSEAADIGQLVTMFFATAG